MPPRVRMEQEKNFISGSIPLIGAGSAMIWEQAIMCLPISTTVALMRGVTRLQYILVVFYK